MDRKKLRLRMKEYINKAYRTLKRLRLKNRDPSILTNNCVGGIMYHDLGLEFLSPTINLFMNVREFLLFLEQLDAFLALDVEDITTQTDTYPIGLLRKSETESVRLNFMHYQSFAQAREKWNARKKRLRRDNIYIVLEYPGVNADKAEAEEILARFEALPYAHKRLLTGCPAMQGPEVEHLPVYDAAFRPGKALIYKSPRLFSVRRYLDDFDYIRFLNSK